MNFQQEQDLCALVDQQTTEEEKARVFLEFFQQLENPTQEEQQITELLQALVEQENFAKILQVYEYAKQVAEQHRQNMEMVAEVEEVLGHPVDVVVFYS